MAFKGPGYNYIFIIYYVTLIVYVMCQTSFQFMANYYCNLVQESTVPWSVISVEPIVNFA